MLMEVLGFLFSSLAAPAAPAFGLTPKVGILEAVFCAGLGGATFVDGATDLTRFFPWVSPSSSAASEPPFSLSDVLTGSAALAIASFSKVNLRFLLPGVTVGESSAGLRLILFSKSNLRFF